LPCAMSWLWQMPLRVEEPPQDGCLRRCSSLFAHIDHEHPVAREFCPVRTHVPVVLHDDLISDIELENDHRSCRGSRAGGSSGLLLDTCPVAKHRKEKFAQTPAFFLGSSPIALCPRHTDARSSLF